MSHSSDFDHRSSAVRSGQVRFTQSGSIDGRSAAVRSGAITLNQDGTVRANSAALNSGQLQYRPSSIPANSERSGFSPAQRQAAWERADVGMGMNPDAYRVDRVGNTVARHESGATPMGWHVDHQHPLAEGGQMHHPNNHQVLQANQNMSRGSRSSASYFADAVPMGVQQVLHADLDYRSSAVRSGNLFVLPNGDIDARSPMVRSGEVLLTDGGDIDRRSSAVRQGDIFFRG